MSLITKKPSDDTLLIEVCDHIDTQNSTEFQQELEEALQEGTYCTVILDAQNLTYISSAGLRVVLALKKKIPDLSIINVSREVYEIFEVTGFTQMIDVKKAYRPLSVDGLEMIGRGTCGTVYRLNPETIVKVFNRGFDISKIEKEQHSAQKAFVNGIETAIPFDIVKVGEQFGIVYEILEADTIRSCIKKDPDRLDHFMKIYSEFLKTMHTAHFEPGTLPEAKYGWTDWIDRMDRYFNPEEKQAVKELFDSIPDRDTFVHGDYNIGNVLYDNGKAVLIDMADASTGHPIYDVAGVYLALNLMAQLVPNDYCEKMTGFSKSDNDKMWRIFCWTYFDASSDEDILRCEEELRPYAAFRVLQASLLVSAFPPQMLETCKNMLFDAIHDGIRPLSF